MLHFQTNSPWVLLLRKKALQQIGKHKKGTVVLLNKCINEGKISESERNDEDILIFKKADTHRLLTLTSV